MITITVNIIQIRLLKQMRKKREKVMNVKF
jgi:hypothetical protein